MDVLAGYDSSSSDENAKIQRNPAAKQLAEPDKQDKQFAIAAIMESSELLNQSDNHTPQSSQQGETSEQKKETSHHSSRRKSSPSSRQRKYRKRSVSESPERSPERKSPENSPSSHRRSRNTDLRDDQRRKRRSRSRSRSRSPRRRRRSRSPRNSTNERDSGRRFDEFGRDLRPGNQTDCSEEKDKPGVQKKEREQSPPHKKGPSEQRGGTRSPEKEEKEKTPPEGKSTVNKSLERDSPSPKRKDTHERQSKSPDRRKKRSRSRDRGDSSERKSPERYRRKDYRRSPPRDSRDRRASGEYNRRHDRDRDRGRGGRGRDWGRDRRYDRDRDRNRDRDRDQDRREEKATSPSQEKKTFVKATATGQELLPRPARPLTSEEVQAKLAAHAESLRKQAQDAASILNLPTYLNPSVVNPHQYAVQAQKRKLLWSGRKIAAEGTTISSESSAAAKPTVWNSTTFSNDQGGEMQAKFRRLMGIKDQENATVAADSQPQGQQLMDDLEKEFERSREYQLSRGAGGKSGIGLGYSGT